MQGGGADAIARLICGLAGAVVLAGACAGDLASGASGAGGQSGAAAVAPATSSGAGGLPLVDRTAGGRALRDAGGPAPRFSFFVTSLAAMQALSGNPNGFGGDLRFGQTGPGAGLRGADEICRTIAERAMPGAGADAWRAFLSTAHGGPFGDPVHAVERIGAGPWYDRLGRLVALGLGDLVNDRPTLADPAIANDLPNENGVPNHTDGAPGCVGAACPDNHDVLTGTGPSGRLIAADTNATCDDWTSAAPTGRPWCGHSWPRIGSGTNWMSSLAEGGCAPGINLADTGAASPDQRTVGAGGGYGALYCFAAGAN